MNVIFLDIDGVLNYIHSKTRCAEIIGIDDSKVKILKRIVNLTDSVLVLTSTWKTGWSKNYEECDIYGQYLVKKLKKENLFLFDKTKDDEFYRGEGIYNWIKSHKVDKWMVIDDEIFDDYDDVVMKHLLKTEFFEKGDVGGLQEKHIGEALNIFQNQ